MCETLVAVVLDVEPSPKSQKRLVIVPVERSVNVTVKGFSPIVGLAKKLATGIIAPVPITELTLPPSFPVVMTTTLLKLAATPGAKLTTRFVEPNPGRLKGVPETTAKPLPVIVALPLVKGAPPRLLRVKLSCGLVPTATVPKFKLGGNTDN